MTISFNSPSYKRPLAHATERLSSAEPKQHLASCYVRPARHTSGKIVLHTPFPGPIGQSSPELRRQIGNRLEAETNGG